MLLEAIPRNISASKFSRYTVHIVLVCMHADTCVRQTDNDHIITTTDIGHVTYTWVFVLLWMFCCDWRILNGWVQVVECIQIGCIDFLRPHPLDTLGESHIGVACKWIAWASNTVIAGNFRGVNIRSFRGRLTSTKILPHENLPQRTQYSERSEANELTKLTAVQVHRDFYPTKITRYTVPRAYKRRGHATHY